MTLSQIPRTKQTKLTAQHLRRTLFGWIMAQGLLLGTPAMANNSPNSMSYGELLINIEAGKVNKVEVYPAQGLAKVKLDDQAEGQTLKQVMLFDYNNQELYEKLRSNKVDFEVKTTSDSSAATGLIVNLFLIFVVLIVLLAILRRTSQAQGNALNFGKSKARFQVEAKTGIMFDDVAGIEEAKEELQEVVTFLKKPERFTAIGAKIPRGVLLVGPPGTGKTLLAKAIAGEAGVPFLSISGSEFVEMFVGVGASRVRDLFRKAKESAPCIIFIDEIDAVGRQRGTGIGGGNDEREQTLNQLLTEMDGFEGNNGVIVIAATNRPDILDIALLRPGRFDRHVEVDLPNYNGRLGILQVHARTKKISPEISLEGLARRTPGFSGADLANVLNEAAILTARRRKEVITPTEIDDALDRVSIGLSLNPLLDSKKKRLIAYHEIGHALVRTMLKNADPLKKVTIIPRSNGVLGFSQGWPNEPGDEGLYSRAWLVDRITILLSGRAAEAEVFGEDEITDGAGSDLDKATDLARKMVTLYGMSELGQMAFENPNHEIYLGRDWFEPPEYSQKIAAKIDREVREMALYCYDLARQTIRENRVAMDRLVDLLIDQETIEGDQFRQIVSEYAKIPEKQLLTPAF